MATPAPPSDATLVRYLLGTLPREDEERFDELSIVDPQFAERLRAVEHDLADAYVRDELSESDRERWQRRYLASPQGRDDLQLAEALAARERRDSSGRHASSWIWGLAAAAVVAISTATGYMLIHRGAARAAPTVESERQSPGAVEPAQSEPQPTPPAVIEPRFVALTLAPATRSLTQPPTLIVPSGTNEVRLTLRLEPDDYSRYDIAVTALATDAIVWRQASIDAISAADGKVLRVAVPASTFRNGRYLINVMAGPRHTEIVASYPLSIVLE